MNNAIWLISIKIFLGSLLLAHTSTASLSANTASAAARLPAARQAPAYVKEIVAKSHPLGSVARILLALNDYRIAYAQDFGFPDMDDYIAQKTAEGMQEQEASDLYEMMFLKTELSENEIERALTDSPSLRADILATSIIAWDIFTALSAVVDEGYEDIALHVDDGLQDDVTLLLQVFPAADAVSEGLSMMFLAIDNSEFTSDEALEALASLSKLNFDLSYSDDNMHYFDSLHLESTLSQAYTVFLAHNELDISMSGTLGDFLLRVNHLSHPPLDATDKDYFKRLGITDEEVMRMLPLGFSTLLSSGRDTGKQVDNVDDIVSRIKPFLDSILSDFDTGGDDLPTIIGSDNNKVGELDFALVVDSIYEPGALSPAVSSLAILTDLAEYKHVEKLLTGELEHLGITMQELVSLLHHPERPASLIQVLQLAHKGFSLEEIATLEYAARDAIIVTDANSKEEFFSALEDKLKRKLTLDLINQLAHDKGQLTFVLLDNGYELDEIQPHYHNHRFQQE